MLKILLLEHRIDFLSSGDLAIGIVNFAIDRNIFLPAMFQSGIVSVNYFCFFNIPEYSLVALGEVKSTAGLKKLE
ncbi:hypothetical protein [Halodesulfovibrio aestuarii]|uniref:Uncharacterized protein n=1 Tax=Halodesulfovibrio aestuarii TaxID=126333 RepID=A0ABV4JWI2_9BACT|nr:hypothetical protein [Halodesulfovibrio aestuarii]